MRKLIPSRQASLFLQSFLVQNLSLTKISNMILTHFQAMLKLYIPLKKVKGNRTEKRVEGEQNRNTG